MQLIIPFVEKSPEFYNYLELFMNLNVNVKKGNKLNLFALIYCFYIQNQNYNSKLYLKYDFKHFSIKTYLEIRLKEYNNINNLIKKISYSVECFYLWIIFLSLFLSITLFENQVFFAIKLLLLFIILYKYLRFYYCKEISSSILVYIWMFVIYCGLVTMIVYFYQFTGITILNEWYQSHLAKLNLFEEKNFTSIGIIVNIK